MDIDVISVSEKDVFLSMEVPEGQTEVYCGSWTAEAMQEGTLYTYIPKNAGVTYAPAVLLAVEIETTPWDFSEATGWKELADSSGIILLIPTTDLQEGSEYPRYKEACSLALRHHSSAIRCINAAVGYGKAGRQLFKELCEKPDLVSAAAILSHEEEPELQESQSFAELPILLPQGWEKSLTYWRLNNQCSESGLHGKVGSWYLPTIMNQGAPVGVLTADDCPPCLLWNHFLSGWYRQRGIYENRPRWNGKHRFQSLKKHQATIAGYKRTWYEYWPEHENLGPIPLVICLHGGGSNAKDYLRNTDWDRLAEEKGVALLLPEAAVVAFPFKTPAPEWNCEGKSGRPDDVVFIKQLLIQMSASGRIDMSRVYITGHSNGGAMTHYLGMKIPELLAACGASGSLLMWGPEGHDAPIVEDSAHQIPTWTIMGQHDLGTDGLSLHEDIVARNTVLRLIRQNKTVDIDSPKTWISGNYHHQDFLTEDSVPMIRYTIVADKGHLHTWQEARMFWEYFCCFKRIDTQIEYRKQECMV